MGSNRGYNSLTEMGLNRQRGFISFCTLLIILSFMLALFLGGKLIPPYMENSNIQSSMEGLTRLESFEDQGSSSIRERLSKQFRVNGVQVVAANDIVIVTFRERYEVDVSYHVEIPMVSNLFIRLYFVNQTVVKRP